MAPMLGRAAWPLSCSASHLHFHTFAPSARSHCQPQPLVSELFDTRAAPRRSTSLKASGVRQSAPPLGCSGLRSPCVRLSQCSVFLGAGAWHVQLGAHLLRWLAAPKLRRSAVPPLQCSPAYTLGLSSVFISLSYLFVHSFHFTLYH